MRFADIPGHEQIKQRLCSMADSQRIPHALLLEGPAGVGKFALAQAFAQYIHCEHPANGDSCGKCASCRQHESFNHVDTIFSFPIVKSMNGGLSDDNMELFRAFLTDSPYTDFETWLVKLDNINAKPMIYVDEANELIRKLSYTARVSKYRIVLVWLPERMNEDAANKMLKLIEEPHSDTLFILTSNNSKLILPTIYSRTQRIQVKQYATTELVEYLTSKYDLDEADAQQISRLAQGSLNEAIKLLGVSRMRKRYLELFQELMRKAYTRNVADLKQWASDVADLGRENEMQFLDYCARLIRENFILNMHIDELNILSTDELQFSQRFSPFINHRNVLRLVDVINDAKIDISANGNQKLINFDVAIKVILLLKQ